MKIALAQLNPTVGDLSGNAQLILAASQEATEAGVQLLITPEMSLIGYPPRDLLIYPSLTDLAEEILAQLAADIPANLAVLVGTVTWNTEAKTTGGKALWNSAALLEGGRVQQLFHKRLLPTYDVFDEDRYFDPGHSSDAFTLYDHTGEHPSSVKIGVTICEDLWNDEEFWGKRQYACNPLSDLVKQGVDLVVNLSASPYRVGKQQLREAMLSHSARRYQVPILYVNPVGGNDDLIFDGCSVAFDKTGQVIARSPAFTTDLQPLIFEPSTQKLTAGEASSITPLPATVEEDIWLALVLGVRDYVRKCRFSRVVLGLSGGIDSALVAAIATAAVGRENVLGILMPSPYSSDHSVQDAFQLASNLGITTEIFPIGEAMECYDQILAKQFAGTESGIAEENLQSRIRGNLLMAISNKFGHLLLSTGNKSEIAVGYCTLYGDMNGGLSVIADVPKTQVYAISHWLNQRGWVEEPQEGCREIIPQNILTKPPSAELKPGQTDQDSLPPYEILDDILHRLIEACQSPAEIIQAGHDITIVNRVVQLVMRAEFKRRQAPPGLKISDRAFGTGWRMPIAKQFP